MLVVSDTTAPDVLVESIRAAIAAPAVRGAVLSMSVGAASCPPCDSVESASVAADERALAEKAERRRAQRQLGGIRVTGAERPAS
jgi:hypothetical protein